MSILLCFENSLECSIILIYQFEEPTNCCPLAFLIYHISIHIKNARYQFGDTESWQEQTCNQRKALIIDPWVLVKMGWLIPSVFRKISFTSSMFNRGSLMQGNGLKKLKNQQTMTRNPAAVWLFLGIPKEMAVCSRQANDRRKKGSIQVQHGEPMNLLGLCAGIQGGLESAVSLKGPPQRG